MDKLLKSWAGFLVILLTLTAGSYAKITKGPFLLRVYKTRAAVMWETDADELGQISYGQCCLSFKTLKTKPLKVNYKAGQNEQKQSAFIHKVWLEDLKAGQGYKYYITEGDNQSQTFKFKTVPLKTDEVTFVVYGDSRTNAQRHRTLVEQMLKHKVDFVVNSGDLVTWGEDYQQWGPQFFEPLRGLAETVPVYIAKGNHEGQGGTYEKLLQPPEEKNNYSFDYGPVYYFCIDNSDYGKTNIDEVFRTVEDDMLKSKAKWKFVSYHVPSLNMGGHFSDWAAPGIFGFFAWHKIDFVLTGHSHQYERFRPLKPSEGVKGNYVTYITTGGGGAQTYDVKQMSYHAYASSKHHFCLFHIKDNKLTMDAIDFNGKVIDHLELTKKKGVADEKYLQTAVPTDIICLHQQLYKDKPVQLKERPQKNETFTVEYKSLSPRLHKQGKVTFKLRCNEGEYEISEPKTVKLLKERTFADVRLKVKLLVEPGKVKKQKAKRPKPIKPALWLDCSYEVGDFKETVSHPVNVKSR
ncbi:MAG: metallophosphoesterase family protein [Planctomycetota bacterium]|jgi:predicted phosphodiesterase